MTHRAIRFRAQSMMETAEDLSMISGVATARGVPLAFHAFTSLSATGGTSSSPRLVRSGGASFGDDRNSGRVMGIRVLDLGRGGSG
jgi:hypothetical protein